MKTLCAASTAGLAVLLCGCPSVRTHQLAMPETVAAKGPYVHQQSGVTFPERVAHFERARVLRYDREGLDVSAGYNCRDALHPLAATVYVYPARSVTSIGSPPEVVAGARARLAENEFEQRKQEIMAVHPGAKLIEERSAIRVEAGESYPGKLAIYEFEDVFAGSRVLVRSHLYLFSHALGNWTVKYRFTHPKDTDASEDIAVFIKEWKWTGQMATSGTYRPKTM